MSGGGKDVGSDGYLHRINVVFKGTHYKSHFGGFETDITHDRVLGISVNIPTKVFCPPMCILFVCSESFF